MSARGQSRIPFRTIMKWNAKICTFRTLADVSRTILDARGHIAEHCGRVWIFLRTNADWSGQIAEFDADSRGVRVERVKQNSVDIEHWKYQLILNPFYHTSISTTALRTYLGREQTMKIRITTRQLSWTKSRSVLFLFLGFGHGCLRRAALTSAQDTLPHGIVSWYRRDINPLFHSILVCSKFVPKVTRVMTKVT